MEAKDIMTRMGWKSCPFDEAEACVIGTCVGSQCDLFVDTDAEVRMEEDDLLGYSHETTYSYDGEDILLTFADIILGENQTQEEKILEIMAIVAGLQGYINSGVEG